MTRLTKGYKFRIYPNKDQREKFAQLFGCCRTVYNHFLAKAIQDYEENGKSNSVYDNQKELTSLKKQNGFSFLKNSDSQALNGELIFLGRAFANFFAKRAEYPRFKKKTNAQSYTTWVTNNQLSIQGNKINIPKIGWVRIKQHRCIDGRVTSGTISKTCSGKYFISLTCVDCFVAPFSAVNSQIGIDLGIDSIVTFSDGKAVTNPRRIKKYLNRLEREQVKLSAKKKGSNNYHKQRIKLAKLCETLSNQRRDFLHKLSHNIVKNHDFIAAEDLSIKDMLQSGLDQLTKGQLRAFHRNVTDVSWYELLRQLEYKSNWYGRKFVQVDRYFPSSQICSCCNYRNREVKDLKVRKWVCPQCKTQHDRDRNAAKNILTEALRMAN